MPPDASVPVGEVLRHFNHDQIYLFLGAAITTVGLLAAAYALLRRRLDPLLLWFSLFALLYGIRLWLDYQLIGALGLSYPAFDRLRAVVQYLVPIPSFFFFQASGFLGKAGRRFVYALSVLLLCLAIATILVGPRPLFQQINNGLIVAALITLITHSLKAGFNTPDFLLLRRALFVFIGFALFQNVVDPIGSWNVEPFGFVIFLAALGYVAGRQALATEQQLSVIHKELEIAQRIQRSILPSAFPVSRSFRVAARYLPMTSVAGDFYDFLLASDTEAGILIADVSGHGVPAALIASMVKLAAAAQSANTAQPADLLHGMNTALCGNTQSQFVTAAYVYLNAATHELRYAAAAHPPMLLLRNGEVTEIAENGLMLAAFDFATYATLSHLLEPGDRLLLYTDGILEAANTREEEFGNARLSALLHDTAALPPTQTADRIITTIQAWSATQNDDLTVLVCDYTT